MPIYAQDVAWLGQFVASQSSAKTVLGLVYGGDTFPTDEVTNGSAICGDAILNFHFGTVGSDVVNVGLYC